jgi:starch-binding outer membrane protein, SusD/RagB family
MIPHRAAAAALLAVLPLAGCYDLEVTNPNDPDLRGAFASGAEVEAHIAGAFRDWYVVETSHRTFPQALSGVSFQHSTWAVCDAPYAEIPRRGIENEQAAECVVSVATWEGLYRTLVRVADGLTVLDERADFRAELGPAATARLRAFARFVQGLAHGSLALLYDRAGLVDATGDRAASQALLSYGAVMDAALDYLYQAEALSAGAGWAAIPAEWMSVEVSPEQLARLARSYAARLRANVARTPVERAGVDWAAVLADAEAGITGDWLVGGGQHWRAGALYIVHRAPRPTQASYFILGMADGSGSYQRWLSLPLFDRRPNPVSGDGEEDPILIVTSDTRFPRGSTVEEQVANGGTMFVIPSQETTGMGVTDLWGRPDRGTWRWSYYRWIGAQDYAMDAVTRWPAITVAELRLLRAEALLRTGDAAGAAALVNESRTAHGLGSTDAAGTNVDCVPRLPDGACGGLMEMLKWEKRLETHWKGAFLSSWYFDGRGWGDLHAGTFLHVPVPCGELTKLGSACYTFGGGGSDGTSPGSGYAWPHELPGVD